ncbi:hypothetical protein K439DRAFT_638699 [Ramaria rubella]|nr:hypothetical protein K439DRAFT_638699 [Ramaria rubella]
MFSKSFKQIRKSVYSGLARIGRHRDSISVRIVTNPYTGEMTLYDGSSVLLRSPSPACSSSGFSPSPTPPGSVRDALESSAPSPQPENSPCIPNGIQAPSTTGSLSATYLSPNSRLFRGSQDEFGFDVYINLGTDCGPAYLFECPTVLPWAELVASLAAETERSEKDIKLSSKVYPCVVSDAMSYAAWLTWSRNHDGPCSTDLWLA